MLGFGLSIEPQLWTLVFTMVRVGAAFIAAPVFGAVSVPVQVRILLAGAIGVLAMNAKVIAAPEQVFALTTIVMVAGEALVGLAIGFVLQIAFAAPLIASELIGTSMGIGFAQAVDLAPRQAFRPGRVPLGLALRLRIHRPTHRKTDVVQH